ncbi:MAG: GNAT family N-acetyltransferase [Gammaproteobacteria bacterium]|nr:GNAT family N-acetyltransferase [Gammaproteobacteria bacterium]MCP5137094.1 GNAT family N-acetyltransferase [Gammaproteobacteria bacterium]
MATLEIHDSVTEIGVSDWNAIIADGDPFLDYAFLSALERHGAVGERFGWLPRIVAARTEAGVLIGAMPMYEKDNSYGELVFDWAWADAYARSGGRYYPKLVVGIPYTPATGARLLVHADAINPGAVRSALIDKAVSYARNRGLSSIHWLFPNERDMGELSRAGMDWRLGTQFHWFNRFGEGYRDFEDYLSEFSSAKRKKLRRERRRVEEQGIVLRRIAGHEVTASEWAIWQRFYQSTFDRKSGYATLSESFFADIGTALGDRVLLVLAEHRGAPVAGALMLRSDTVLYGRHWGCDADYHSLHFEACYYQGIDYAIERGLRVFEPGAQGEHKIQRGFRPTSTWSAHWLADPGFDKAVRHFLINERRRVAEYQAELTAHLPFKQVDPI